jgi:hypothetical protein
MNQGKGLEGSAGHPADRNVSVKACSGLNIHMLSRGDSHDDSVVVETMSASLAPHSHGETAKALIHLSAATRPLAAKALQESAPATAKLLQQPAESLKKKGRQLVVTARFVWSLVLVCTRLYTVARWMSFACAGRLCHAHSDLLGYHPHLIRSASSSRRPCILCQATYGRE